MKNRFQRLESSTLIAQLAQRISELECQVYHSYLFVLHDFYALNLQYGTTVHTSTYARTVLVRPR